MDFLPVLGYTAAFHVATFVLYAIVPASVVTGYVLDSNGAPSRTRLPGFSVLVLSLLAAAAGVYSNVVRAELLYESLYSVVAASCACGLVLTVLFFIRGQMMAGSIDERSRCPTVDQRAAVAAPRGGLKPASAAEAAEFRSRSALSHAYAGLSEFNPVVLGVDIKMWLYTTGAVLLQLHALSALAADAAARGGFPGVGASTATLLLTFFIFEYCWQEHVHLYTYDIIRERIGFKLLWGCVCFYPSFYVLPVALAASPGARLGGDLSAPAAAAAAALFFAGWALTRGANLQKFACKAGGAGKPLPPMWGFVSMETVPGSGGRILCGGFWGISRHVNYFGEITQALALALPAVLCTGSPLALAYPAYYIALFVPRQIDDDAVCEAKYGKDVWGEYCKRVPSRIVPGVW